NKLCKDMDILRPNLNKYCRDEVQRFDSLFLSKLCHYFNCTIGDIMEYIPPEDDNN
ncbi:helix-turn-helix transcriptional regulator, partial [Coprobacillus cateniformis]|nr:helix-turn-helix transcriptional regulator [Coprobacillus cateniformis]